MRILFLTHRLPYAPNRGDRIRAFHMIKALATFAEVSVVSLVHDIEEAAHVADVRAFAHDVRTARVPQWSNLARAAIRLPSRRPLTLELLHAPTIYEALRAAVADQQPDLVFAYCSSMARYALEAPLEDVPFILDMVDVDSEKWRALGRSGRWPKRLVYQREAQCLAPFERIAVRAARVTLTVNAKEADAVRGLAPGSNVQVIENGIDLELFRPSGPPSETPQVVFVGVFSYGPNEEAALRLAHGIWPLVRQRRPDARLVLVGANPSAKVRRLATQGLGVSVTGTVPDVRPYLWGSAVAAVPLLTARGLQNKVLEALAAGLPTVISPVVADGLPDLVRRGCTVAESDAAFAGTIVDWLGRTAAERRQRAGQAGLESLTWQEQLRPLRDIVLEAASIRSRAKTRALVSLQSMTAGVHF